jgi:hypothetical protein
VEQKSAKKPKKDLSSDSEDEVEDKMSEDEVEEVYVKFEEEFSENKQ